MCVCVYISIYTHTMEYSAAIKNEILPFASTWIDIDGTKSDRKRQIQCDLNYMCYLKKKTNK